MSSNQTSDDRPLNQPPVDVHLDSNRQLEIRELIGRIKESADKLAQDEATRGDLKIVSRALRELRYAFKVFSPYRRHRKVTVFGSARTGEDEPTYRQAMEFGESIARHGWLVVTGAASGIMEAGHRGAGRDNSMGLNIMLPFEQEANSIIAGDHKLVHMKYFFTRKLMFVKECDALVCLPGGFGTLDEFMEVLTLLQTGKRDMAPVVLLDSPGGSYWKTLHHFITSQLLAGGMISKDDLNLYKVTEDCQEAVREVLTFFEVYHSMRYVRDKLVLRLNKSLDDSLLEQLNAEFQDIMVNGDIRQGGALAEESDEPELAEMTRLILRFNRRSLGRLRRLIDCVNAGRMVT